MFCFTLAVLPYHECLSLSQRRSQLDVALMRKLPLSFVYELLVLWSKSKKVSSEFHSWPFYSASATASAFRKKKERYPWTAELGKARVATSQHATACSWRRNAKLPLAWLVHSCFVNAPIPIGIGYSLFVLSLAHRTLLTDCWLDFCEIVCPRYTALIPGTVPAINTLRNEFNIKVGCTTGFTKVMVDVLLEDAKKQGSCTGNDVSWVVVSGNVICIWSDLYDCGITSIEILVRLLLSNNWKYSQPRRTK